MTTTNHTPTPWYIGHYDDGNVTPHIEMIMIAASKTKHTAMEICHLSANGKGEANAAFIVKAANNHAALAEKLGNLLNCVDGQHDPEWLNRCKDEARAVLAAVEGK